MLSAVVLIISIIFFRRKINFLQAKMVRTREKLMLIHTAIFLLCIAVYFSNLVFNLLFHKNLQTLTDDIYTDLIIAQKTQKPVDLFTSVEPVRVCREFVAGNAFIALTKTFTTFTLILFIYMSVEFSKPISAYWKKVLAESTRQEEADQGDDEVSRFSEQEQAMRFHEAAVKDANRRISIMKALL